MGAQKRLFKSRIPPLVLASSRHPATFRISMPIPPYKISKGHLLFKSRTPPTILKLSRIPPIEMRTSPSRQDIFIPYSALSISRIPHPASIVCPIPHPVKSMLDPHVCVIGQHSRRTKAKRIWIGHYINKKKY